MSHVENVSLRVLSIPHLNKKYIVNADAYNVVQENHRIKSDRCPLIAIQKWQHARVVPFTVYASRSFPEKYLTWKEWRKI